MRAIKERDGIAIAQSPDTALYPGMPLSAIENAPVDYIKPVPEIAALLAQLAIDPVDEEGGAPVSDDTEMEADIVELESKSLRREKRPGVPSRFTCPECSGVLWEIDDEGLLRFRCRIGHAYSAESLLAGQFDAVESALWAALRALEENISLSNSVAARMRKLGHARASERFERKAREAEQQAEVLRQMFVNRSASDPAEVEASGRDSISQERPDLATSD